MVLSRFSATANSGQAIQVAVADPVAGTIQPRTGVGAALLDWETQEEVKIPEP